jgi:hypothetical protein
MFLHVVGHNQRFRVVQQSFRRSIQTVHKHFRQVLYAVDELRNDMIKPPNTTSDPKTLGSHRWSPYCLPWVHYMFTFTMFFVSHTWVFRTALVPLMAPMCWLLARITRCIQQAFRGRKKEPTQNVMVAVRFDHKLSYMVVGWEGSTRCNCFGRCH